MKRVILCGLLMLMTTCMYACGNPCKEGHTWNEATCTTPKTCSVCEATEGTALGHDVQEYNVTTAATCLWEGEEQGNCVRCNESQSKKIEKKPHNQGEWKVTISPTSSRAGIREKYCISCGEKIASESFTMTAEEIKAELIKECEAYSYQEIARNPDKYKGKKAKFTGKIMQVMEDGNTCAYRINITRGTYSWDDTIYALYTRQDSSESRILEDDIVTLYGTLAGNYTYETVMGAEMTIPAILAEYIDLD